MIKKWKSSLSVKVAVVTAALLVVMSFLVYGILAWIMPDTYSNTLNETLNRETQEFIGELEKVTKQESGGLFQQFLKNANVTNLELYDESGQQIGIPTMETTVEESGYAIETAIGGEAAPVLSDSFFFSFSNSAERYMLNVYGEAVQLPELRQAFVGSLPLVAVMILVAAVCIAWIYSRMITKPVLKISHLANEMSEMRLDWQLEEKHTDELGTLEKSLNEMSGKLKHTLSELQEANVQLEADIAYEKELEQKQREFFQAASHELKTPITVIKGQLEGMLLGVGAYKERDKYLARSLQVANNLERMVQEILTISRLESTGEGLVREVFDCVPMIRDYLADTEDLIMQKELRLELDMPEEVQIYGNRFLLEKVFTNLMGNAVKYAPSGGEIWITVQGEEAGWLFSFANTGNSIPEEEFTKIFDAFYRVEQSRNRQTGGSGLGLYIVRKVLEQHGSICHVKNTETGVLFSFLLK
ncbi:MAG: HAMP domain-containing sensor histidine kinase [Lachnospiraceae bacterium]|nr:HAMP domain-containing sensor histidine kinase [Lachnospiraceae bacterium]